MMLCKLGCVVASGKGLTKMYNVAKEYERKIQQSKMRFTNEQEKGDFAQSDLLLWLNIARRLDSLTF